jgi:CubicO group peptidase (beta-lactamase class C family)
MASLIAGHFFSSTQVFALNSQKLSELNTFLWAESPTYKTEGFVLYHDNKIVHEKYMVGDISKKYLLWSMSKTVTAFIFGVAEDRGLLNREHYVSQYVPQILKGRKNEQLDFARKLKLKHLLNMTTGFDWNEKYEDDPFNSHVVRMLYFEKNMAKYVWERPFRHEPGKYFYYSSGDTNLISYILKQVMPIEQYNVFPWTSFFEPMQIDAIFEQDAAGVFSGASYVYMAPKDLIKLGLLVLHEGQWEGKQVISKNYMQFAKSMHEGFYEYCEDGKKTYGAQLWLNHPCPKSIHKNLKDGPDDLIMFLGHEGQSIFVFPTQGIVALRLATDKINGFDRNKYVKLILEVFEK